MEQSSEDFPLPPTSHDRPRWSKPRHLQFTLILQWAIPSS